MSDERPVSIASVNVEIPSPAECRDEIKWGRPDYSIVDISELAQMNKTTPWFNIFRDRRFPEPSQKIGKRFYYPEPEAKKIIRTLAIAK